MTVVAGIVTRSGRVYLAGDTQVSAGDERTSGALRKTRRTSGIVLGACGDLSAVGAVLAERWVPPWRGVGSEALYLESDLRPSLHTLVGARPDVSLLVGVGGQLWYLDQRCCHRYADGYGAIGTGAAWATGALAVLWGARVRPRPQAALRRAVGAAEHHCSAVGGWGGVVSVG